MSPRRNWDSPNPSLANECAPSPGTVTFFIQTFFIRDKVYTNFLYTRTKFIQDKVYTGQSLYGDKVYTGTKFIQSFFIQYLN
jgi:hypothetical protein